jgi:hypothetical protein
MILGWKQNVSIDTVLIASNPGGISYLRQFQVGLNPNDTTILRRWGLVTEAPQSYTPDMFAQLLQRHGPLWVAAASLPAPHIRVVTGFQPPTTVAGAGDAIVAINDPWERGMAAFRWPNRGSQYNMSYIDFTQQVERLGRSERRQPAPVYVAHLP